MNIYWFPTVRSTLLQLATINNKRLKEMKSALKFCVVNRGNRKNRYSKNNATMYNRSYSDLGDSGKYAQLASWSLIRPWQNWVIRRDIIASFSKFLQFSSLGHTHEIQLMRLFQGWIHPPYQRVDQRNQSQKFCSTDVTVTRQHITPDVVDGCLATMEKTKDEANTEGAESRKITKKWNKNFS